MKIANKHLIFCRTYDETSYCFQNLALRLGERNALYTKDPQTLSISQRCEHCLCDKFDACTSVSMKIIASFTKADGELRTVVATVAFSMGLDALDHSLGSIWGFSNVSAADRTWWTRWENNVLQYCTSHQKI